jgi:hypothetical protein
MVKARPENAVPKGTMITAIKTKTTGIAQRNPLQRRLDEEANRGRRRHVLHGIENLAVSVKHRPVRLLRGNEMSEYRGRVRPPVPAPAPTTK